MQAASSTHSSHPSSQNLSYSRSDWQRGYRSLKDEYSYWIDDIDGEIPQALSGTLFRNGPAMLDVHGQRIHHPFDGDGMIAAIAIQDGQAYFHNRYVRTEGFVAEQKAKKILYRGVFGTQKPGGWLANAFDFRLKNIANTNVIHWGNKLLALWEAAEPHQLNPYTLETLGLDDVNGAVPPGKSYGAHPWLDPACQWDDGKPHMVNFSISPGLSTTIRVFEHDPDGNLVRAHAHSIPGFAFIHDFAITPHYCIFFQAPLLFNPIPFVLGLRGPGQCISFQEKQPTQIIVIPRDGLSEVKQLPAKVGFVFHHGNAWETETGELEVYSICYETFPTVDPDEDFLEVDFNAYPPGQLWRFRLNLDAESAEGERVDGRSCEFPQVHPDWVGRRSRFIYLGATHEPTGNAPLQAIWKVDLETGDRQLWSAAPRGFISEPIFAPRPHSTAEDDGWLLTMVFNAERDCSELVILDARNLEQGAIATLKLKHHIPYSLHGYFSSTCFLPPAAHAKTAAT